MSLCACSAGDICRVCRSEGTQDKPLYHPCVCTGSIKFIHQEWCVSFILRYYAFNVCPSPSNKFSFTNAVDGHIILNLTSEKHSQRCPFCVHSLLQWLKHSRKEYCELCKHRFAFTPSKVLVVTNLKKCNKLLLAHFV